MYRAYFTLTLFVIVAASAYGAGSMSIFNIRDYGAVGDGIHKETGAFSKAIDACSRAGGGTVYVPPGRYLTGTITLKSHVTLDVDAGAVILGSGDPADYPLHDSVWDPAKKEICPLIYALDADNVGIRGRGTIDGQGQNWWRRMGWPERLKVPRAQRTPAELAQLALLANGRPHLIEPIRCRNLVIAGLHLINSASWTVSPLLCEFVRIDGLTIENPVPSPNTDGIDPESCRNVQIVNCRIDAGDDCVTLKSGMNEAGRRMGRPDENITIANCIMLHGHGGVVIGSEMSGGVRNVVINNCVFQGTQRGIRIKSQRGRGGVVEGVETSNIVMENVPEAFSITTFYSGRNKLSDIFPVNEGTPVFRDLHFSDITARGSKTAGEITGLREMPVSDITFSNVQIQAQSGMRCTNAKDIAFFDVNIDTGQGPALAVTNCSGIDTARLHTSHPHEGVPTVETQ
jgi:polygalacturonase